MTLRPSDLDFYELKGLIHVCAQRIEAYVDSSENFSQLEMIVTRCSRLTDLARALRDMVKD